MGSAGPQVQVANRSGQRRASTGSSRLQWAAPGLNGELRIAVGKQGAGMSKDMPDKKCQKICHKRCQNICQKRMPADMPEDTRERMRGDIAERMSKDMPERMPEDMSEDM